MIFNTQVFEFSDPERAKAVWMTFKDSYEAAGGTDVHMYRDVDNPNRVLATMSWPSAEACRQWGAENEAKFMEQAGEITTNAEREDLWQEY